MIPDLSTSPVSSLAAPGLRFGSHHAPANAEGQLSFPGGSKTLNYWSYPNNRTPIELNKLVVISSGWPTSRRGFGSLGSDMSKAGGERPEQGGDPACQECAVRLFYSSDEVQTARKGPKKPELEGAWVEARANLPWRRAGQLASLGLSFISEGIVICTHSLKAEQPGLRSRVVSRAARGESERSERVGLSDAALVLL